MRRGALGNTWLGTIGPTAAEITEGWNAFLAASAYTDLNPETTYKVDPYERGFAFGIIIEYTPLDVAKASANGWLAPLTLFDGGDQSWYQDPGAMFDVVHAIHAPGGASVHADPFGPWNQPLHFFGQVVPGWLLGTTNYPQLLCSLDAGCAISGH